MAGNKYLNEQGLGHLWERIKTYTSSTYLSLTGGNVTGPVNFEDSVYISDLNAGNLVVTGNAAFTNNIQANTINGVEVGLNPKFTDTWNKVSTTQDGYVTKLPGNTTSFLRGDGSWATPPDTTYIFDGTYNSSTNKVATVNTVTNAINALDGGTVTGTPGAGKTITALSQSNGLVSATFNDISIKKSQISDFPTSMPASDVSAWAKASTKPSYHFDEIQPLLTKTYTGVIATANDQDHGALYFIKIQPQNYGKTWSIRYRVTATIKGVSVASGQGYESSQVYLNGMRDTYSSYSAWNDITNTSYRPYYYHCFYRAKQAGITNGYGHALGIHLRYSYNPTTAANSRTVTFEIIEAEGCTVTFLNEPLTYLNWPGTGSTNYNTYNNFDAVTAGMTEAGDRNDVNYYNRTNFSSRTTSAALYRYQLCLTKLDGTLVPVNSVDNSIATNKTLTMDSFNPFGEIFYWNSTSTYSAGGNVGNGSLYRQYLCDLRYSFNCGGYNVASTLIARKPLYLVAVLQDDGTAELYAEPLSMQLPSSEDNLIYIYLGRVYEDTYPYRLVLSLNHPVYEYRNGAVRLYNGLKSKAAVSGGTDVSLVTTGEKYLWNSKTNNTGTVTSVAAAATDNSGITISGSPITSTGTITIDLNLNTAINKQLSEGTAVASRDNYAIVQHFDGSATYHRRKLSNIFAALNSTDITNALGFTPYNSTNPNGYTSNTGTVTSVRVQANPPLQSSTSTAQSSSLNTTISFVNQNANVVLAGPSSGNAAAPTFRALVAADIPSLSKSKISDFPTSMPPTAHTHAYIVTEGDNRLLATTPNDYTSAKGQHPNRIVFRGLKNNSSINSPSSDNYSYLVGLRGWSDDSGGNAYEIAFNNTGIFVRKGATTVWGDWEKVLTDKNITEASILKWQTSTTAATNVYDFGVYVAQGTEGATGPTNGNYYAMLNIPYRKAFGNTKADYSWSIAGSTNNDKRLFYRTSGSDTWGDWAEVAHINVGTAVGNATQPVYVSNTGVVTACTSYANASVNHATSANSAMKLSQVTDVTSLNDFIDSTYFIYTTAGGSNTVTNKPTGVDAFGVLSFKDAAGWQGQILVSSDQSPGIYWRTGIISSNAISANWLKVLDSNNYTDYTVTKTGTGATGNWEISITGNAATATTAGALTNKVLNSTTIHNTAGSFTFQGSGEPWAGTDWVGLQVGSNVDKFQIRAINGATLGYRQNDSGGTNTSWGGWYSLLSSGNYTDYTVTKTGEGANGTWGIDITGNANTSKYLMNRGSNAVSINDSTWGVSIISQGHTIRDKVWHQQWKQSGLKFTPQGGSESNITDSADLVYYLSSSNTANSLTLNMAIDGIVYAGLGFKGVWNGNTISIAKGGTGQTTAKNAINALLNGLDTWTANPTDDTYFIRQDTNGAANYGKVKFSTIWNYIKTKTNASFNPGSLTITIDPTNEKKALISFTAPSFS